MKIENPLNEFQPSNFTKEDIEKFIKEIEKRLEEMENDVKEYTIDRFEENIAICEERNTKTMIQIPKEKLPLNVQEGTIIIYRDGEYFADLETQKEIEERIEKKMNQLWEE